VKDRSLAVGAGGHCAPAAPVGACARPLNFTVRSHAGRFRVA
jgi:hypothetical protein